MGFAHSAGAFLGIVLLCGIGANAETSIAVVVNDSAKVGPAILLEAEKETTRLFRAAGISIRWLHCGKTNACHRELLPDEFVLHIVPAGKTQDDFVFGEAFLGQDGRGQYSDVFFDRVRRTGKDSDVGRLLGVVAAHELGHLLLGSHGHSQLGIMQPVWERDCVRRISMGMLLFTPDQARSMRRRIEQDYAVRVRSLGKDKDFGLLLATSPPGLRF
jgi:hypothetical protein